MQRTGKTAIVTGASAGLGVHFARLLARDGHDLVLIARRRDKLDKVAAELRATGTDTTVIAADLAGPHAPRRIHDEIVRAGAEADFLVNNAGFGTSGACRVSALAGVRARPKWRPSSEHGHQKWPRGEHEPRGRRSTRCTQWSGSAMCVMEQLVRERVRENRELAEQLRPARGLRTLRRASRMVHRVERRMIAARRLAVELRSGLEPLDY